MSWNNNKKVQIKFWVIGAFMFQINCLVVFSWEFVLGNIAIFVIKNWLPFFFVNIFYLLDPHGDFCWKKLLVKYVFCCCPLLKKLVRRQKFTILANYALVLFQVTLWFVEYHTHLWITETDLKIQTHWFNNLYGTQHIKFKLEKK